MDDENRFVCTKKRNASYDAFKDEWVYGGCSFWIDDTKNEIPRMYFLKNEDMMTVYELLKTQHMIFDEM